ncbi:hypothetical protein ISN44_As03g015490 [Arabidopsis suecica]|uniref:Uncharacterized protein n=2 Tax=Arabidopsis TaxID=3701 RepID=A0A5S9XC99_ARATH|nr:hypothetical protein ISN44_As03g015490 [Arabidopsis suecica]CAA0382488.1 unnamed protein product [Arabidopsis thaliana]
MDSTSNDHQELEQFEAIDDLLEDFWFFDNLLDRRSRILRYCHSDPYPFTSSSSSTCPKPELPKIGDSDSEIKLLEASTGGDFVPPPCIEKKEGGGEPEKINKVMRRQFSEKTRVQERRTYLQKKEPVVREKGIKEGSRKKNRTRISCSNNNSVQSCSMGGSLQRTQTLPSYLGREDDVNEFQDQEIDDSRMGFLIREAIANSSSSSSGFTPTKQNIPKVSCIPRHRPPRNSRSEDAIQELVVKSQKSPNRKTLRKTLSSIETKDIQMLKDLHIETEKKQEEDEEKQRKVPCTTTGKNRSTAVVGQPIPVWVPKDSRKDMKAQIKFWARTVASNVRQEC